MLKIDDVSRLSSISIRTFRYYGEHGILKPAGIDEEMERLQEMIMRVNQAEQLLNKENTMMKYEVSLQKVAGMFVMCKCDIIPGHDEERCLWDELYQEMSAKTSM